MYSVYGTCADFLDTSYDIDTEETVAEVRNIMTAELPITAVVSLSAAVRSIPEVSLASLAMKYTTLSTGETMLQFLDRMSTALLVVPMNDAFSDQDLTKYAGMWSGATNAVSLSNTGIEVLETSVVVDGSSYDIVEVLSSDEWTILVVS